VFVCLFILYGSSMNVKFLAPKIEVFKIGPKKQESDIIETPILINMLWRPSP
jgi:hypothetical protein